MDRNEDLVREAIEGVRRDAEGRRLITPRYCHACREDANYGEDGIWYCTAHWQRHVAPPMVEATQGGRHRYDNGEVEVLT